MIPCCGISFFATLFLVKGHSLRREDDARLQEEGKKWAANREGILSRKKKQVADGETGPGAGTGISQQRQEEGVQGENEGEELSDAVAIAGEKGATSGELVVTPLEARGEDKGEKEN